MPTLEALATTVDGWQGRLCALLDARRKEVYAAVFAREQHRGLRRLSPDMVVAPDELWPHITPPCLFVGDGAEAYQELIRDRYGDAARFVPWTDCHSSGTAVARLGAAEAAGRRVGRCRNTGAALCTPVGG